MIRLSARRYSAVRATACPSLKTAWRLERRMRQITSFVTRRHIWIGTSINRPHVGDVILHTVNGDLRIVPSGAVRRV